MSNGASSSAPPSQPEQLQLPRNVTVLVVEDEPTILEGVSDLLEVACANFDVTVLKAGNGRQALDILEQFLPDLIISDVGMPVLDGRQLLAMVRQNPRWVHIPFIFLTARTAKQDVIAGRLTGAELYITKPFDSQTFVGLVETQLAKALQQAHYRRQRLELLKREILRALQHEFRTPLTYVTAYYEILSYTYTDTEHPEELQDYLQGILSGSQRLMRLVGDLIEALELRTGETLAALRRNAAPVTDLAERLRQTAEAHTAEAAALNIRLHSAIPPTLPPVYGHAESLTNLTARLLDNALKFTRLKGSGEVWLTAEVAAEAIVLRVRDSGIGFPPQVAEQLFDLFYQHGREQWEQQGPGVGLSIARGLAELHNGRIVAHGEPGVGAEFVVTLPVYGDGAPPALGRADAGRRHATLLVVEDDPLLLEGLTDLLTLAESRYTYRVLTAANGREGLAQLTQTVPDLILSDILMPVMDGYAFLQEVRRNPDWIAIPFLFLTARNDPRDVLRGNLLGADEYITKPYDSAELLSLVAARLDRHFQKQQVTAQDFEALKDQILNSLEGSLLTSLSSVTTHSQQLRRDLQQSRTVDDLKQSLQGLQSGSAQLAHLVENFTTLLELRTGAAQSAFVLRRRPLEHLGYFFKEQVEGAHFGGDALMRALDQIPRHCLISPDLPVVAGDRHALGRLFNRALYYMLIQSTPGPRARLTLTARPTKTPPGVQIVLHTNATRLTPQAAQAVSAFLTAVDGPALNLDEGGSDLTIVKEYTRLHDGAIGFAYDGHSHTLTLTFPAAG